MEPIRILRAPKEAFNKSRPISDLIRAQIKHFRDVEKKLTPEERARVPQGEFATEGAAAEYVSAMTRVIKARPTIAWKRAAAPVMQAGAARPAAAAPAAAAVPAAEGLALAAAAEETTGSATAKGAGGAKKNSPGKSGVQKSGPRKSAKKGKR